MVRLILVLPEALSAAGFTQSSTSYIAHHHVIQAPANQLSYNKTIDRCTGKLKCRVWTDIDSPTYVISNVIILVSSMETGPGSSAEPGWAESFTTEIRLESHATCVGPSLGGVLCCGWNHLGFHTAWDEIWQWSTDVCLNGINSSPWWLGSFVSCFIPLSLLLSLFKISLRGNCGDVTFLSVGRS